MKILRLIRGDRSIDTEWHNKREPSQTIITTSYFKHRQYNYEFSHVERKGDDLIYIYMFKNEKV